MPSVTEIRKIAFRSLRSSPALPVESKYWEKKKQANIKRDFTKTVSMPQLKNTSYQRRYSGEVKNLSRQDQREQEIENEVTEKGERIAWKEGKNFEM